jgi:hypothetical protein
VPIDRAACPGCRLPFKSGPLIDLPAPPGSPVARRLAPRKRISEHDYIPPALRAELEARRATWAREDADAMTKRLALTGAALAAIPYVVPSALFLPWGSFGSWLGCVCAAFAADAALGAVIGILLARFGGSMFRAIFLFAPAFVLGAWVKWKLGYPITVHQGHVENMGALAALGGTVLLTLLVAGVIGSSLEDRPLD